MGTLVSSKQKKRQNKTDIAKPKQKNKNKQNFKKTQPNTTVMLLNAVFSTTNPIIQ